MIQGVGKGKETQLVTGVGVFSQQLVFAHRFSQELVFANRPLPSLSASDDFFCVVQDLAPVWLVATACHTTP
jgi:hypothetical protein